MPQSLTESHLAVFTKREADTIRSKLCEAARNARTAQARRYLSGCAAGMDSAMALAKGDSVEVYGTLGFLRMLASQGGEDVVRVIERQLTTEGAE